MLLDKLRQLLEAEPSNAVSAERQQHLASAALLVEVARADFEHAEEERESVLARLQAVFNLSDAEVQLVSEQAEARVEASTSLYEFTRVLNDLTSLEARILLVEDMWRVAFADGELSHYEEHLIRRVADLLHVSHRDFIRTKHAAAPP